MVLKKSLKNFNFFRFFGKIVKNDGKITVSYYHFAVRLILSSCRLLFERLNVAYYAAHRLGAQNQHAHSQHYCQVGDYSHQIVNKSVTQGRELFGVPIPRVKHVVTADYVRAKTQQARNCRAESKLGLHVTL